MSEGVVAASLEHSCGADYVAAMRPRSAGHRRGARHRSRARRTSGGRTTSISTSPPTTAIVCSELVMKAYEPTQDLAGLRVPWITVAGRRAVPPTEIVRLFASRARQAGAAARLRVLPRRAREGRRRAVVADAAALAGSRAPAEVGHRPALTTGRASRRPRARRPRAPPAAACRCRTSPGRRGCSARTPSLAHTHAAPAHSSV